MIVIGVDVHQHSVTAVAVDEAGRTLAENRSWSAATSCSAGRRARRGAVVGVEDCRQLTRWLERQLLEAGEELVRVPPKLTVPERRAAGPGQLRPIDALAVATRRLAGTGPEPPAPDDESFAS